MYFLYIIEDEVVSRDDDNNTETVKIESAVNEEEKLTTNDDNLSDNNLNTQPRNNTTEKVNTQQVTQHDDKIEPRVEEEEEEDMNRSSHDTFSLEFHLPVESDDPLHSNTTNKTEQQDNVQQDRNNQKKCLWYDYSQEETSKENKHVTEDSPVSTPRNVLKKQPRVSRDYGKTNRQMTLTRDPSLAWDDFVDVYNDEDYGEEKLDVIVDFDDGETLHQVLTDVPENNLNLQETLEIDDNHKETEYNINDTETTLDRSLGRTNYENDTVEMNEIRTLINGLDEHYKEISSDVIIENINKTSPNTTTNTPRDTNDDVIIANTLPCYIIHIANHSDTNNEHKVHNEDEVIEEEKINALDLEPYSFDMSISDALGQANTDIVTSEQIESDEANISLTKRIYKKKKKLRSQKTEDFTVISDDEKQTEDTRLSRQRRRLQKYQTTEEFTEISSDDVGRRKTIEKQQTEEFTIISDEDENSLEDEKSLSDTFGSQLNLETTFSDCPPSSGVSNIYSGIMRLLSNEDNKEIEMKEKSSSEDELKIIEDVNEHDDDDSGKLMLKYDFRPLLGIFQMNICIYFRFFIKLQVLITLRKSPITSLGINHKWISVFHWVKTSHQQFLTDEMPCALYL